MRILEVGLSHNPGGVESFIMNYYRRLTKMGVQFDFICMYDSLAYEDEIKSLGGKIYYLPNVKKHPFRFKRAFSKILDTGLYQTVHVNMLSAANILPLKTAAQKHIPQIIAHSHNTMAPGRLRNLMHDMNLNKVRRYATDRWACSKDAAVWLFGEKAGHDAVIMNNAIDVGEYAFSEEKRRKMRMSLQLADAFVLGHVGRMEEQKNHEFLLKIMKAVAALDQKAVLLLAGDGILKDKLVKQAQEYGIDHQVRFLGLRNDIPQLLSAMDVFVFPSFYEGLSVTAVEAQCAGLPCFVSEGLTPDTAIGEGFYRISLEEPPEKWAQMIERTNIGLRREADNDKICKRMEQAGFSIDMEAERFYRRLYNDKK